MGGGGGGGGGVVTFLSGVIIFRMSFGVRGLCFSLWNTFMWSALSLLPGSL